MADETSRERAERRRRTWQATLEREGRHAPAPRMAPAEALGVMWELARDAWLLGGNALPEYEREDMPGRIFRDLPPR